MAQTDLPLTHSVVAAEGVEASLADLAVIERGALHRHIALAWDGLARWVL